MKFIITLLMACLLVANPASAQSAAKSTKKTTTTSTAKKPAASTSGAKKPATSSSAKTATPASKGTTTSASAKKPATSAAPKKASTSASGAKKPASSAASKKTSSSSASTTSESSATTETTAPAKKEVVAQDVELRFGNYMITFKAKGETQAVSVQCNYPDWKVVECPSWIKYSVNSYGEIVLEAERNTDSFAREGLVKVRCRGTEEVIEVKQKKKGILDNIKESVGNISTPTMP